MPKWFLKPKPNPSAAIRLICFPYSGASASIYFDWANILPSSIEIVAVQLPGRANRLAEPLLTDMASVIDGVMSELPDLLDRPFALFGHSLGAQEAFETALALRRAGLPQPARLFVSGHGAPHAEDPDRLLLHRLDDEAMVAELRKMNGMAPEILENEELMQLLLPILRADFTISETYKYRPEPPLDCPISAYSGLQDAYVTREQMLAWKELTSGDFRLRMFPGDHFYLNTSKMLLLQALARDLDEVMRQTHIS